MLNQLWKVCAILVLLIGTYPVTAWADRDFKEGDQAVSFSIADEEFVLGGRLFLDPSLAVLARFGFEAISNDNSGTNLALGGGVRQYLSKRSQLHPFVEGTVAFVRAFNRFADETESGVQFNGRIGVEYFLAKQVSAEGAVGATFQTISDGADVTSFGTVQSAITVNFYLD